MTALSSPSPATSAKTSCSKVMSLSPSRKSVNIFATPGNRDWVQGWPVWLQILIQQPSLHSMQIMMSSSSSSSLICSLIHSHANLEWCDEVKLSNLLLPRKGHPCRIGAVPYIPAPCSVPFHAILHCHLSDQRFQFCLETFHSLLSRWAALSKRTYHPTDCVR